MNKKQKKEKKRVKIKNKKLLKMYPWLQLRNVFSGKKSESFECTYFDWIPFGWRKKFGMMLIKELHEALKEDGLVDKYRIFDIKEKYGSLRWYDNGGNKKISEIITKYEVISGYVCIRCGQFDVPMIGDHWIEPMCEKCFSKYYKGNFEEYKENYICPDTYSIRRYGDGEVKAIEYDISDTVRKLRYGTGSST